jgi:hypothetical protein
MLTDMLLVSVSRWTAFESITSTWTREACVDAVSCLLKIACGLHTPESMLDFLDPTVHNASLHEKEDEMAALAPAALVSVASTTTAAYAVEVMIYLCLLIYIIACVD